MSDRVEMSAKEVEKFLTIVQENPYVGHYISNGKLLKISPKLLILLNF